MRKADALSLFLTTATAALFGALLSRSHLTGIQIVSFFLICSTYYFFTFQYPLAFHRATLWTENVSNYLCHCALAVGFGFFFFVLFIGGGEEFLEDHFEFTLGMIVAAIATGVFVYFFFQIIFRFGLGRKFTLISGLLFACSFPILPLTATTDPEEWFLYSAAIVIFLGTTLGLAPLIALSGAMTVRKLIFDLFLFGAGLFLFFTFVKSPWTFLGMGQTESDSFFKIGLLACSVALFIVIDYARQRSLEKKRTRLVNAPTSNADSELSSIFVLIRSVGGTIYNYTVVGFPIALLAYRSLFLLIDGRIDQSFALPEARRKLPKSAGLHAMVCYVAIGVFPLIPLQSHLLNFEFGPVWAAANDALFLAVGASVVWIFLYRLSQSYAPDAHQH